MTEALTDQERAAAIKAFEELGLCAQLAEAAASLGWKTPSVIQQEAVPPLLQGAACPAHTGARRSRAPQTRRPRTPRSAPPPRGRRRLPNPFRSRTPPRKHTRTAGNDVIGLAQTGSGKTGAFALPILQGLMDAPQELYALVLSPTRELAIQISEQFEALGAGIGLKTAVLVGGIDMMAQARAGAGGVEGGT